jgi:hypothetical protein
MASQVSDLRGTKRIRRDGNGDLVLKVGKDEIRWHKALVYQEKDGEQQIVAVRYAVTNMSWMRLKYPQVTA